MRLNRYIAACTKYSRRQADDLIKSGKIFINGKVQTDLSYQVKPLDRVFLNNDELKPNEKIYYILNKPVGVTVSSQDKNASRLITDLVPKNPPVFAVGRLDRETSGLIILTNDGNLAQELSHPKFEHSKEYQVVLDKPLSKDDFDKLAKGIDLKEGVAVFDSIKKTSKAGCYKVVIHQGWNRQIRRMFAALDKSVISLERLKIGGISLGGLPEGKWIRIAKAKLDELIKK